tara:strand:+ start:245 stop:556 length:312 start_codon:yes stop_codon:yes gene_type:complete
MREPANCFIDYCGYKNPTSKEELEFEILGLKHAIMKIESRIALLNQSQYIASIAINKNANFIQDIFRSDNESNIDKVRKREDNSKENRSNKKAEGSLQEQKTV